MTASEALLEVSGLSVHFGGLRAVDEVSFRIGSREILGLVGPNGAGKTTTFNAVYGMVHVTRGKITFRGRDTTGQPPERITPLGVARTFQNVRPFGELSVRTLGAILERRFAVPAAQGMAPDHPTLGDVDSPESLAEYQAAKRAHKAAMRAAKAS